MQPYLDTQCSSQAKGIRQGIPSFSEWPVIYYAHLCTLYATFFIPNQFHSTTQSYRRYHCQNSVQGCSLTALKIQHYVIFENVKCIMSATYPHSYHHLRGFEILYRRCLNASQSGRVHIFWQAAIKTEATM